jgi:voltage-gated potassium channel
MDSLDLMRGRLRARTSRRDSHGPDASSARLRRRNRRALRRYLAVLVTVVAVYTVLFRVFMMWEGQSYSWVTGLYWTLTTMTTLGLGDIVFHGDAGRVFTAVVLVSGMLQFFLILPFAFVRFFYAPWLQARARLKQVGHVIITRWDNIAPALVDALDIHDIPYVVVEPNPEIAGQLHEDGIYVVTAAIDDRTTYEHLGIRSARMVLANGEDTTNTNVTLTVRDVTPSVDVVATAESDASIDILGLAGASRVLALKRQLGEQLAGRINAGRAQAHVIGSFRQLRLAEFPVHNTPFAGRTLAEIDFRDTVGVNVIGVVEHARFARAGPETVLTDQCLPIVLGTDDDIQELDEVLAIYDANPNPVLVIGGGKVGCAAARQLRKRSVPVHMIEQSERLRWQVEDVADRAFIGNAAERDLLMQAGLAETPGVLLTTNDDAMNIYLAVYCRRLAPQVRIISRITHDRNMAAIRRAGADLALSHTSLGVETIISLLTNRELMFLGEGVEVHEVPVPNGLEGLTLAGSAIAARTGLNVIALHDGQALVPNPQASAVLKAGSGLLMVGSHAQLREFRRIYR